VADAYGKLVALVRSTNSKYETPSILKSALASRNSQFAGYAQQDAQEFLSTLLEYIGEDVSRVNKKSVPYKELTADTKKHSLQAIVLFIYMQSN
jgi:ubiquitin C-terminal hydrolase